MQDSITKHKRFTASRPVAKEETQRVFDQAAGGARDVSPKEAREIRDRDFKAKQDVAMEKERNKPAMEGLRQQKSNQVLENLRGVIARKESDRSRGNAALLAENPYRENANRMMVGLQPQDRAALFSGTGSPASSAISAKDRSVIEGNISKIVNDRLEQNMLPSGVVMGEDGNYVDEATKEPVNVREIMMNEERTRVYGQANQAVSQIQGSTDFAGVLAGIGQANKMGLNWQDQLALSYRPTMPDQNAITETVGPNGVRTFTDTASATPVPEKEAIVETQAPADAGTAPAAKTDSQTARDYLLSRGDKTDREVMLENVEKAKESGKGYSAIKAAREESRQKAELSKIELERFNKDFVKGKLPEILRGNKKGLEKEMPELFKKDTELSDGSKVSLYDQIKQANEGIFRTGASRREREKMLMDMFSKNPNLQKRLFNLFLSGKS
jgi:hypothetical protein